MKVLLISNICEQSGYSLAAESTLKSLYYNRVDVAARNINLTGKYRKVDNIVDKALNNSAADCDFLLIHSLPSFYQYDGRFKKCIGKFDYETDTLPSNWKKKCALMDQIWVSSNQSKDDLKNIEQIKKPVFAIPHAVDINRFERDFSKSLGVIGSHKKKTKAYCFYTIGEFAARKNYEALLQAWYLSFSQKDNVELFIKTSMPNTEPRQVEAKFMQCCEQIKNNLKLNKRYLKDPIVIADTFDDLAIDVFHSEGDCFVSTSHAEGFCLPARDAILFGKPAIIPNHTGFVDYAACQAATMVEASPAPCYGALDQSPEIYNGSSIWYNVNIMQFKNWMQTHYLSQQMYKKFGQAGKVFIHKYSYVNIGKEMIKNLIV